MNLTMFGEMKNKEEKTMKKINFMLFAVAAIAAASCAKEIAPENPQNGNNPEVELISMTFTAGAEKAGQQDPEEAQDQIASKVLLQSDGKSLHWESTDQIKVFDGISNDLPAFTTTGSGASADFTGGVSAETGTYYALYPYQEGATFGASTITSKTYGNVITATIPAEQIAVAGGVPSNAFISAAKSDDGNGYFKFKTVCGFIKFQLSEEDAANAVAVSLSGNDLGALAGDVEIYFTTDGENSAFGQDYVRGATKDYVTLTGSFQADTDYYFAIRSNKFASGFTMTIRYADGSSKYVTTTKAAPQTVSRNTVMNIGKPVFKPGLPNDLYIAWQHGLDIDIAEETFNKATYGAATLFTADKTVSADGVYFINPGTAFKTNYNAVGNKLIVVGRYSDQKSTMTLGKVLQPDTTEEISAIAFKNLDITYDNNNQPFQVRSDFGCIALDNCTFDHIRHTFITASVTVSGTTVNSAVNTIAVTNCDIKIMGTNKSASYIYMSNKDKEHGTVRFKNNIVYFVPGTVTAMTDFKLCQISNAAIRDVTMENNIFDKTVIPSAGMIKAKYITGYLSVQNNLFNEVNYAGGNSNLAGITTDDATKLPTGGIITQNFYYTTGEKAMSNNITKLATLSKSHSIQKALDPILGSTWNPAQKDYTIADKVTYYNSGKDINVDVSTATLGAKR